MSIPYFLKRVCAWVVIKHFVGQRSKLILNKCDNGSTYFFILPIGHATQRQVNRAAYYVLEDDQNHAVVKLLLKQFGSNDAIMSMQSIEV